MTEGLCPLCEAQEVFVLSHNPQHGGAGADMRLCQEITSGSWKLQLGGDDHS